MTQRDFDVEALKVHRIEPPGPKKAKRHLGVLGQSAPELRDLDEAFGGPAEGAAVEAVAASELEERVVETLKTIHDPEIPLNIYDLGLIYGIDVDAAGEVEVRMTLTAPACPVAGQIVTDVADRVGRTPGVRSSHVKLVWDPPWTKDLMTEDALLELGLI
ncbi:MAG: iron-sulfur cluster assembly protein [Myxococcota bacterium]